MFRILVSDGTYRNWAGRRIAQACLLPVVFVVLGACAGAKPEVPLGKGSDVGTPTQKAPGEPEFLHYIPADAAYVFAAYEPLPRTVVDYITRWYAPIWAALGDEAAREDPEAWTTFKSLWNEETLVANGIDTTPRFAIYNIGATLVMRVEVLDGDKLRAFLQKIAKETFDVEELFETSKDVAFASKEISEIDFTAVWGIRKNELIFALIPNSIVEATLPALWGHALPAKSIADSGALSKIASQYGLRSYGVGYWNLERTLELFTRPAKGIAGSSLDLSAVPAACKAELASIAKAMPSTYFGYETLSEQKLSMVVAGELDEQAAETLSAIATSVPSYAGGQLARPVMSFGIGLRMKAFLDWFTAKVKSLEEAPFVCENLRWANKLFTRGTFALVPPALRVISGAYVRLDRVSERDPLENSGVLVVRTANTAALLKWLGHVYAPVAKIALSDDGSPQELNATDWDLPVKVLLAKGGDKLAVSLGNDMIGPLAQTLQSRDSESGPFLVMEYDYAKLGEWLWSSVGSGRENATAQVLRNAGRTTMEVYASEPGFRMRFDMRLE